MNFAYFGMINAKKYPGQDFLIERNPERSERRVLTWKEFNEQTNKVANYLKHNLGVKKGDFVLHLQMNSIEWYVTFHAILRVGATAVPLSFRFASQDIMHAAKACGPVAFILSDGFLSKVQPIQEEMKTIKHYICIGEQIPGGMIAYESIIQNASVEDILVDVDDDDPAELMFTSGTTGPPKPVCQSHKTLYEIGVGNALTYDEGKETVYLAPQPFYHSGSFFLSFPCYLAGGKIVILNGLQPKWLLDCIVEEKVNNSWITVPTMSDAVNAIKKGEINIKEYDFSHFTGSLVIGAQPVPPSLLQDIKRIFPFKTGNIYGITEGGGGGSINLYDEDVLRKPGSIGKPTFYMEARAVDDNGNDVPAGGVGELILKGSRIMKEYYSNPEMTAKTIKDGWLYTGDLVKIDEEGYFYIVDRKKDLIIRGGENIFPVEIEAVLFSHPKIQDVAIIGYPHERLVEIAMAIVTLKDGETMTEGEVIEHCKNAGLAKFKWPERIVFDVVLRNPTGKIDKPKLREKYIGKREVTINGKIKL
ncbi:MAG: Long-chain-fatty-acid--CoA ligase FadD13 [Pelotomaculum sp. PtaB.Bin013]|uniref:Acyl--CoA ligase n=1 Tax=Pelotomaculum isophthalicicum JI TaxID=947010 RepID=A0A9X4GY39_9FIRM|nr:class I adenylate-forming enzyme family protein [Pelotomaculum isophthalicicum]MDF9407402.1 acyl--CoA ligase [Pelotomaculum isophthalicicum JI]OPX83493.1 MAG: Long-chain-fatty-acid--CoA ligase FadD13 [Pelotomaculum sp. PtaB.Bin013]